MRGEPGGEWGRATPEKNWLQTQTHPKEDDEQEDLEEGAEDVGVAADEENEGDEGGDTSIEDGRPHVHQRGNE